MQRILFILILINISIFSYAQPRKSRTVSANAASQKKEAAPKPASDRATLMFPTSDKMPEDVVWRRDVYRQLDLLKDVNAPLYYPVEPHGKEQNLFTFLFRLFVSGRIDVYEYKISGDESFEEKDKANVKELLDKFRIYYEETDGKITVPESDIPSAQVTRFLMKESSYFDQRSATYKARVTALCPVLMEGDEFETIDSEAGSATPKPLFWVKYDDVAAYLSRMPVMASNLNNVTNMSVDDYFTMNRYNGKIYKTNNLQGRILKNDSTLAKEQERIEQQLKDFEEHIWHKPEQKDSLDSIAALNNTSKSKSKAKKEMTTSRRSEASAAAASKKPKVSSSGSRVSARRQRR